MALRNASVRLLALKRDPKVNIATLGTLAGAWARAGMTTPMPRAVRPRRMRRRFMPAILLVGTPRGDRRPRALRDHSLGPIRSDASFDVMTGCTSNSTRSLQFP